MKLQHLATPLLLAATLLAGAAQAQNAAPVAVEGAWALAKGSSVPLTLVFQDAKGVEHPQLLQLPVATSAPGGQASQGGHSGPAHKH